MEINWSVLVYLVIAVFILGGFSSGWWKEAIVTFFLGTLVFFLQNPDQARSFIDLLNQVLFEIWQALPQSTADTLAQVLGLSQGQPFQADPSSPTTWLVILLLGMVIATQTGRLLLPSSFMLSPMGRLLGGALGGVNGLLVVNLVREYLDGRSLPGAETAAAVTGVKIVGSSAAPPPSPTIAIRATDLPSYTILDSGLPWIVVGIGLFLLVAAIVNSVTVETNAAKMRRVTFRTPFGYNNAGGARNNTKDTK